ncbi:MAG: hypothetical protein PHR14_10070 [Oscillospiraceae bacterium]|nr:hypothetical protein [Oscillospiraceae bacterium]
MLQAIIGALCGIGLFFILADIWRVPHVKTSGAIINLSKSQKGKSRGLDIWLGGFATWLSKHLRINEYKRIQLESDLKTARMDLSPERFKADAIIKASLVGVFAIPVLFIFPLLCPVILFMAVFLYSREMKSVGIRIKAKRERIEYELLRLVFTIDKTLKHNRDVLYMLESYAKNAGAEMKHELDITAADMRSGNYVRP